MKFNCGLTPNEKYIAYQNRLIDKQVYLENWHIKFAFFPTRMTNTHNCIWLEKIERIGKLKNAWDSSRSYWDWQYREKSN